MATARRTSSKAKAEAPAPEPENVTEPTPEPTPEPDTAADIAAVAAALDAALTAEQDEAGKVPATGALEPPAEDGPADDTDKPEPPVAVGEVGAEAVKHRHGLIVEQVTQQPPAADDIFVPVHGSTGSVMRCTKRLLQVLNPGDAWSSSLVLVMPQGQEVSEARAEQMIALVRSQAEGSALEAVDLAADTIRLG